MKRFLLFAVALWASVVGAADKDTVITSVVQTITAKKTFSGTNVLCLKEPSGSDVACINATALSSSTVQIFLPAVDGTLATLAGTETFTNKSIAFGQLTGLGTGVATWLGTPTGANLMVGILGCSGTTNFLRADGTCASPAGGAGLGDVVGPASAVNNRVVFFDGTTGKLIKDSGLTLSGTNTGDQTSVSGNAGTATALTTGRTIAITGDLAYTSPSFDGSGNVTAAGTLATVNSNVGSFTNANITVNAKGLVTAAANGTAGTGSVNPSLCAGRLTLAPGFPVYAPTNAIAASGQDTSAETVTLTAHGWVTGTMAVSSATSGGLTAGTQYYLNVASANAVSFHTTVAAAEAGTSKVDITGTVTATITPSGISRTSIVWTPYKGAQCVLYDGAAWSTVSFTETSLALGTLTASLPYDVYSYNNSGTLALELLAWTSDTARATALVMQDGVLSKTGALTRRYLGTIRTNSTTTTIDDGGMLLTNVGGKRFVWNYGSRVDLGLGVIETAAASAYTTQTWRVARATAGNIIEFVIGVAEDAVDASIVGGADTRSSTAAGPRIAVGVDSVTVPSITQAGFYNNTSSAIVGGMTATYNSRGPLAAGYHYLAWLERGGQGTSAFTYLDVTGQAGMVARIRG